MQQKKLYITISKDQTGEYINYLLHWSHAILIGFKAHRVKSSPKKNKLPCNGPGHLHKIFKSAFSSMVQTVSMYSAR